MERLKIRGIYTLIGTFFVFMASCTFAQDQPIDLFADQFSTMTDRGVYTLSIKSNVMEVDSISGTGAHLKEGQLIVIVGPRSDGTYSIAPLKRRNRPAHNWKNETKGLAILGTPDLKMFVSRIEIETDNHPATDMVHPMVIRILDSDKDGPKEIEIMGPSHLASDTDHGGRAHAHR